MHLPFYAILLTTILVQSQSWKPYDDVCDDGPPAKRLKSSCYFSVPRTSPLELTPRDSKFKVTSGCEGELHSMIALARNDEGRLFGAANELALVSAGGEGLFLDENSDISHFDGEVICEKHLNELSRHFLRNQNPRLSKQRESGSKCASCAYPEVHSAKATRTMPYQKSHYLLLSENILVPPGTPLCARHYNKLPNAPPTTTKPPSDYAIPDPPPSIAGDWGVADFSYAQGPIPGGPIPGLRRTSSGNRDYHGTSPTSMPMSLNGSVVVEVIKHMSEDLTKMGINTLHLRSDNAGYYHSAPVMATIIPIAVKYSINIASWSFSEAQSGKSSSDRYASYCKTIMRVYMAKGKNIDTPAQMFVALTEGKGLRGMSVHLGTVEFTPQPKTTIKGISTLGHFEFNKTTNTISAWRFRGIGKGMTVSGLKPIESLISFSQQGGKLSRDGLKVEDAEKIRDRKEPYFWFFPKRSMSPEPGNVDDEAVTGQVPVFDPFSPNPLFVCGQCSARFIRHERLLRHIENGRHKIRPEKVSMFDFALGLYKGMLEEVQKGVGLAPLAESFEEFQQAPVHPKPMGWALRSTKKGARYDQKARQLVADLFEDYFTHSKKLRAEEIERRMKERSDILPSERMSHEQIKNCIRSLVAAKKKEIEAKGIHSRRRRALLDDIEKDFEEEDLPIEEEVDVTEDERVITSDAIYDMIYSDFSEFFEGSMDILDSNSFFDLNDQ